jgi:hypothetical protein
MAKALACLPSKHKALSSNLCTTKNKNKKSLRKKVISQIHNMRHCSHLPLPGFSLRGKTKYIAFRVLHGLDYYCLLLLSTHSLPTKLASLLCLGHKSVHQDLFTCCSLCQASLPQYGHLAHSLFLLGLFLEFLS